MLKIREGAWEEARDGLIGCLFLTAAGAAVVALGQSTAKDEAVVAMRSNETTLINEQKIAVREADAPETTP